MVGFFTSQIHAEKALKIEHFGLFPWEKPYDNAPRFQPVDKDAFERIKNFEFPA